MKRNVHWGPVAVWHHRILGGLWALCGLAFIGLVVRSHNWNEVPAWIAALCGIVYVAASIGFILLRTWARRTMGVLMVLAALYFFDMMMMAGVGGNRGGVHEMLVAIGVSAYTLLFLAVSALWHSQDSA